MGVGGQLHAPGALPRERDPVSIVQEAGWAPGPVWTDAENLAPTGIRSPDRPARSESLYRLRYPGPQRPPLPRQNLQMNSKSTAVHMFLMYAVYSYRSRMPGFEPYLLGKIREQEVTYNDMNLSFKRTSMDQWGECCVGVNESHSDISIPVNSCWFIHNLILHK
jgi:hypothetical protein